jgi:FkbH-like protein
MQNINQLKKLAKSIPPEQKLDARIAVLGDSATQLLVTAIRGYAFSRGMTLAAYEAEYDQIFPEILNPDSGLYQGKPDYTLIYMSAEKLHDAFCKTPPPERNGFAERMMATIHGQWDTLLSRMQTRIIQFNFVENDDQVFGNFGNKTADSYIFQLRKLNFLLMEQAAANGSVSIADLSRLQNEYGRRKVYADAYWYSARLALSIDLLPAAAKLVVDIIEALRGRVRKCVVCDLDNTLWGGVIGDDGLDKIQIGELGSGRAFTDFQKWLKELKERGILLAVCSKNNEETAKEPFLKHPDMVLRLDDFAVFVANWEDKASNIRHIQQILNIGMDAMVFLDDNPFERDLVRQMIPEICVPELPEDPSCYLTFLQEENLFETAAYSSADADRTAQYQAEAKRVQLQQCFASMDDYLKSLCMTGTVRPFDEFSTPRIAQLTQRSNQFNLRTVRYTEAEIAAVAASDKYITRYFTLRDKFGDHGLISVLIMEKQGNALFVNTWLMSCRVLKRTVEEFIVNSMISTAKENGFSRVIGEYIPTPKNAMVKDIYEAMGFARVDETHFEADVAAFVPRTCFITREA